MIDVNLKSDDVIIVPKAIGVIIPTIELTVLAVTVNLVLSLLSILLVTKRL